MLTVVPHLGHDWHQMKERLTESIKTRVTPDVKKEFKKLAKLKHLDPSDLQREAFRRFLEAETKPT